MAMSEDYYISREAYYLYCSFTTGILYLSSDYDTTLLDELIKANLISHCTGIFSNYFFKN